MDNAARKRSSILARRSRKRALVPLFLSPSNREADLSAKRAPQEAPARIPSSHGDAGRTGDSQAPPGSRPQAALGLSEVNRRHRLSRSRDFDAVYRHGRSVSTRFLILYSFSREDDAEPRLGIAVPKGIGNAPVRSKIKRRLREAWRARVESLPRGQDFVLIVRPGLVEAADARGFEWLGERVDEVLGKAAA